MKSVHICQSYHKNTARLPRYSISDDLCAVSKKSISTSTKRRRHAMSLLRRMDIITDWSRERKATELHATRLKATRNNRQRDCFCHWMTCYTAVSCDVVTQQKIATPYIHESGNFKELFHDNRRRRYNTPLIECSPCNSETCMHIVQGGA